MNFLQTISKCCSAKSIPQPGSHWDALKCKNLHLMLNQESQRKISIIWYHWWFAEFTRLSYMSDMCLAWQDSHVELIEVIVQPTSEWTSVTLTFKSRMQFRIMWKMVFLFWGGFSLCSNRCLVFQQRTRLTFKPWSELLTRYTLLHKHNIPTWRRTSMQSMRGFQGVPGKNGIFYLYQVYSAMISTKRCYTNPSYDKKIENRLFKHLQSDFFCSNYLFINDYNHLIAFNTATFIVLRCSRHIC